MLRVGAVLYSRPGFRLREGRAVTIKHLIWTVVIAVAASTLVGGALVWNATSPGGRDCGRPDVAADPTPLPFDQRPVLGRPLDDETLELGRDQRPGRVFIHYSVKGNAENLVDDVEQYRFAAGPFLRGKEEIAGDDAVVAQVLDRVDRDRNGRRLIEVELCIDPGSVDSLSPGTYSGSVFAQDPRLRDVAMPVTVKVQSPHIWWLFLPGVPLAAAAALWAGWSAHRHQLRKAATGQGTAKLFVKWFSVRPFWLGAAALAGAYTYWRQNVQADASFGADPQTFLVAFGAMVVAAVGASTGVAAIAPSKHGVPDTTEA